MFIRGLGIGLQYQQVLDATVGPPAPPVEDDLQLTTTDGEGLTLTDGTELETTGPI